jgi:general secretion pathway protein H
VRQPPATGPSGPRGRGFTLIEILVVLVIIAVMTSIAVYRITLTGVDRGLELEGDRLSDVIAAATQQSGLEGRDLGLLFVPDHYAVFGYSALRAEWQPITDDRLYDRHALPEGIHLALELEGKPSVLKEPEADQPVQPQLIVSAAGDISSYHLVLSREGSDYTYTIEGQPDGSLKVTRPGQTP